MAYQNVPKLGIWFENKSSGNPGRYKFWSFAIFKPRSSTEMKTPAIVFDAETGVLSFADSGF
jgi:hypothetical protein